MIVQTLYRSCDLLIRATTHCIIYVTMFSWNLLTYTSVKYLLLKYVFKKPHSTTFILSIWTLQFSYKMFFWLKWQNGFVKAFLKHHQFLFFCAGRILVWATHISHSFLFTWKKDERRKGMFLKFFKLKTCYLHLHLFTLDVDTLTISGYTLQMTMLISH